MSLGKLTCPNLITVLGAIAVMTFPFYPLKGEVVPAGDNPKTPAGDRRNPQWTTTRFSYPLKGD